MLLWLSDDNNQIRDPSVCSPKLRSIRLYQNCLQWSNLMQMNQTQGIHWTNQASTAGSRQLRAELRNLPHAVTVEVTVDFNGHTNSSIDAVFNQPMTPVMINVNQSIQVSRYSEESDSTPPDLNDISSSMRAVTMASEPELLLPHDTSDVDSVFPQLEGCGDRDPRLPLIHHDCDAHATTALPRLRPRNISAQASQYVPQCFSTRNRKSGR
jgi:hypothetical protein